MWHDSAEEGLSNGCLLGPIESDGASAEAFEKLNFFKMS